MKITKQMKKIFGIGILAGFFLGILFIMMLLPIGKKTYRFVNQYIESKKSYGEAWNKTSAEPVKQGIADRTERYSLVNDSGVKVWVPVYRDVEKSPYDWTQLKQIGGYKYYATEGNKASMLGIDVSRYQSNVDWKLVKQSGIDFAMIRVGFRGYGKDGKILLDEKFVEHISGAANANMPVGVYFFSQAITEQEAIEEAQFVLDNIKGYTLDYPIVYDTERIDDSSGRANKLTVEERTKITIAFCEKVKNAGYEPMVYANERWFALSLDLRELTDYKIWLAAYRDEPIFKYKMAMWQYTDSGKVNGIDGVVDMNILFKE